MPKAIVQDAARQARSLADNTFETIKKQPGEMIDIALEQLGVTSKSQSQPQQQNQQNLEQMKARDADQSRQQIQKLEQEITQLKKAREQQLQQRRMTPPQAVPSKPESLPAIRGKRSRGLAGFWGKRVQSAQQQSQPEMVGKRVGG